MGKDLSCKSGLKWLLCLLCLTMSSCGGRGESEPGLPGGPLEVSAQTMRVSLRTALTAPVRYGEGTSLRSSRGSRGPLTSRVPPSRQATPRIPAGVLPSA